MKKLVMIALFAFPPFVLAGCDDSPTVVEGTTEEDVLADDQMEQYQEYMKTQGSQNRPGN